jgi:pimeloyl-ACP methyl ester carboxylesterase
MDVEAQTIATRRGAHVRVFAAGPPDGRPVLFLHGLSGLLDDPRFAELLAQDCRLFAPELPGYGASGDEALFEDMLDFSLHGWDILVALGLERQQPVLIGHSLGGMIAAEMACLAPGDIGGLVLVDPLGLWLDEQPIPDVFAMLPYEFGEVLFASAERAAALLPGTSDLADPELLRDFVIANARRLGTAGKLLFPIPNRRLSKRLYRLETDVLLVWGEQDRYVPPAYAEQWTALLPRSELIRVPGAGHMLPYEQPDALAEAVRAYLARRPAPAKVPAGASS